MKKEIHSKTGKEKSGAALFINGEGTSRGSKLKPIANKITKAKNTITKTIYLLNFIVLQFLFYNDDLK